MRTATVPSRGPETWGLKLVRFCGTGALFALKRKKMYEGEINKIQGARMTLEQQRMALESMVTNMEVFSTMQSTAGVMGDMHHNLCASPPRWDALL